MLKKVIISLIISTCTLSTTFASKHLRSATFTNEISSDKSTNDAYAHASVSSNTQLTICPSNPSDGDDCKSFGDCYYLAKAKAKYGQSITLNICGTGNQNNAKNKAVMLSFDNILNNNSYNIGTANCSIVAGYSSKKMNCQRNTQGTDYKIEKRNQTNEKKDGKDKGYKIEQDS